MKSSTVEVFGFSAAGSKFSIDDLSQTVESSPADLGGVGQKYQHKMRRHSTCPCL